MSAYNEETISFRGACAVHDFQLNFRPGWGYHEVPTGTVTLEVQGYGIEIDSDSEAQTTEEPSEARMILPRRLVFPNADGEGWEEQLLDFEEFKRAMDAAWELVRLINAWNADAIAEAQQREAEEEQRREEEAAAQKEIEDERAEIMMQELVGERVKIRHRGYKTMCYGTVEVIPLYGENQDRHFHVTEAEEPTGYKPIVNYSDQGDTRDSGVGSYRRLDAKTERGWRTVWDDGKDDLPEYDRAVKLPQLKPYN